ncbi:MAG: hypothetical protein WCA20_07645 [Candidatus Sulfotelmatobacter sp.]
MTELIGIEEHFVTTDIRAAWASSPIGQEDTGGFDRGEIEDRLDDLVNRRCGISKCVGSPVPQRSATNNRADHPDWMVGKEELMWSQP